MEYLVRFEYIQFSKDIKPQMFKAKDPEDLCGEIRKFAKRHMIGNFDYYTVEVDLDTGIGTIHEGEGRYRFGQFTFQPLP